MFFAGGLEKRRRLNKKSLRHRSPSVQKFIMRKRESARQSGREPASDFCRGSGPIPQQPVELVERSLEHRPRTAAPVAFAFEPKSETASKLLTVQTTRAACAKNYKPLYDAGFAIQDTRSRLIQNDEVEETE